MKMKKIMALAITAAMTMSLGAAFVQADDVFKIGAIGPLTGAAANYGNAVVNGAQIAVDEINEAGGLNGVQIEYKGEDDELDNEKSVSAYNALKDWGMQILVGPTTSGCTIAVAENTKADNMFQITPSGSSQDCTKYDNVFRVCFSDPAQGTKSADYISEKALATKIGIIYDSSDPYSAGIEANFEARAAELGLEIAKPAEAFTADNNTDFTAQLQKCKDAGVDLIYLPIYYTQAATILTQAYSMGIDAKFFGCDGLDGMLAMDNFQKELAEGVLLLTPFVAASEDEKTVNFVEKYKAANNDEIPNQFAADAYDGLYIIKQAIEEAGLTPDMEISDLCDALKVKMTEITYDGLTGTGTTWDASGAVTKDPNAVIIENGTYVSAE